MGNEGAKSANHTPSPKKANPRLRSGHTKVVRRKWQERYSHDENERKSKGLLMSEIADRVKKIVVEHLGVEAEKVSDGAAFIDDLGADSLDTVELVMAFEEEFGCEIPDDAAEHILTVGDAVKFLEQNASAG